MRLGFLMLVASLAACRASSDQEQRLLGNTEWSARRAFHDKSPKGSFRFEYESMGCYAHAVQRGRAEVDGPRSWIVESSLENGELEIYPVYPRGRGLRFATTEEEMASAMCSLASPRVLLEEPEFFLRSCVTVRFDWDEDGRWDDSYSWLDDDSEDREPLVRALLGGPLWVRVCEH